ncbi:MAG TPA: Sua5 family C-terminal domain-containing protein [Rhodocyclaceae bacterium]|nr:Sua5 family C-terminal domain-containing protein [Rhodocyclaceae bacterium]
MFHANCLLVREIDKRAHANCIRHTLRASTVAACDQTHTFRVVVSPTSTVIVAPTISRHAASHRGVWIKASSEAASYAHDLYSNQRALDACGAKHIVVEEIPAASDWDAVRDRLGRAVTGY